VTTWRSQPLPADWPIKRRRILERDGYRCYLCSALAGEVDHIVPAADGGNDQDSNLAAICTRCHRSKTGREARAHRLSTRRPTEIHPGFIQ
jgi:5-methylcytosine-specific restriction protein A